jgi:hypothetical protein
MMTALLTHGRHGRGTLPGTTPAIMLPSAVSLVAATGCGEVPRFMSESD